MSDFNTMQYHAMKETTSLEFANRESGVHHNSYYLELRMLESVEQGNLDMLEACLAEEHSAATGSFGIMSNDLMRSVKNVCISAIALISRAAIRGGVHYETAFSMCDSYVKQIEAITDLEQFSPLMNSVKRTYTGMVREIQKTRAEESGIRHPYVEKAKNYIYSHLHGRITLEETAEALGINRNYLSNLFRKYEGVSFSDFVISEKIRLTKNLLTYSDYSFSEIAAYLGFSSQSHLSQVFKAHTGKTLSAYRNLVEGDSARYRDLKR